MNEKIIKELDQKIKESQELIDRLDLDYGCNHEWIYDTGTAGNFQRCTKCGETHSIGCNF